MRSARKTCSQGAVDALEKQEEVNDEYETDSKSVEIDEEEFAAPRD